MNRINHIISVVFHPVFITGYVVALLFLASPVMMYQLGNSGNQLDLALISIFSLTILLPIVSILMMRGLGFIQSLEMESKEERVGPLLVSAIFYLWLYFNLKSVAMLPHGLVNYILGVLIAIFFSFFFNNFYKISLHAVAAGGFASGLVLIRLNTDISFLWIELSHSVSYVSFDLVIMLIILLAGLVGCSRLAARKHTEMQVYTGYLVGIITQVLAWIY